MIAGIQTISLEEIRKRIAERRRSRFQGVLDGIQGTPKVDFFCNDAGTAASFFDFHPTKRVVLSSASLEKKASEHAFLHFSLTNISELYGGSVLRPHRLEPQHCAIGFVRIGNNFEARYQADQAYRHLSVHMDPALLIGLMQDSEDLDGHAAMQTNDSFSIIEKLPIDGTQSLLIRELFLQNAYEGAIRDLYRESKLLELICATAARLRHGACGPARTLDRKDATAIYRAKELLLADIVNPPSLKVLANRAGTNEFKLKKGFKQVFGQTVYGLLHEVRLREARRLIEQDGMGIHETAKWVGYKSASHFSGIFKRRFGILPKQLQKQVSWFC